ncbi:ubiquitin-related domain-containing protein [Apiospora arundinis]
MAETTSSPSQSKDKQPEVPQPAPSGTLPPKLEGAVEMDDLTLKPAAQEPEQQQASMSSESTQAPTGGQETPAVATTAAEGEEATTSAPATTESKGKEPATETTPPREDPLIIGGQAPSEETNAKGDLAVEILLISTSSSTRHPFNITEKYLTKRKVNVPGVTDDGKMDPLSITVYSLKELILREWRQEWETAPREPASIRLIRLGKMLDDKATLRSYGFSGEAPNVVHMTVKPQELVEEEGGAAKGSKEGHHDSNEGGCCCIVL